jgi:hypothetical protein
MRIWNQFLFTNHLNVDSRKKDELNVIEWKTRKRTGRKKEKLLTPYTCQYLQRHPIELS